jgi:hypothetical protein
MEVPSFSFFAISRMIDYILVPIPFPLQYWPAVLASSRRSSADKSALLIPLNNYQPARYEIQPISFNIVSACFH